MPRAVPIGLCLAALLTGCGDSGLDTSELQREGRQICSQADRQLRAIPEPHDTAATVETARRTISVTQRAIDRLAALDPPGDVEGDYKRLLADLRTQQRLANELITKTQQLDSAGAARIVERDEQLRQRTAEAARRIGIPSCVRP